MFWTLPKKGVSFTHTYTVDIHTKFYRNYTYIIAEKFCVVSRGKSVDPETRGSAICVLRINILFIFSAFRLNEHIVHTAVKTHIQKLQMQILQVFSLLIRKNVCLCERERQVMIYLASRSVRRWDSSTTCWWRCVFKEEENSLSVLVMYKLNKKKTLNMLVKYLHIQHKKELYNLK